MEKMRDEEIQQAIENLKIERAKSYGVRWKIISQWKLKTSLNGVVVDLGKASTYIKTNLRKSLTEDKEEALQSVELFLKEYFLQNAEQLGKRIKEGLKNN